LERLHLHHNITSLAEHEHSVCRMYLKSIMWPLRFSFVRKVEALET